MPGNLPHIPIPHNTWVDLYALSGITVGQPLIVENVGVSDLYLAVQATQPPADHTSYNILKRDDDIRLTNILGDPGAWAFCNAGKGLISVAEREGFQPLLNSALHDGDGNPIGSLSGAIDVHVADVHRIVVNDYLHRHGTGTTLTAAVIAGDTDINVTSAAGFIVGGYVHMGTIPVTTEPVHPQITDIIANNIFLDRPLDNNYANGEDVSVAVVNMSGVGSLIGALAAPIKYRYLPQTGRKEHITRIILSMTHSSAGSDDQFGGIPALLNGVVLRVSINGQIGTFTNWKNNSDITLDMFDVEYSDKAGPGLFGTKGRGSFSRIGVVVALDDATGDYFEILIQDDLQDLTSFRIKAQGHVEGG